jgi:probable HAF family extracellular repeat protein
MTTRSSAPSAALAALLAVTLVACGEDGSTPTGPDSQTHSAAAAVTTAASYSVKDLGTLGGSEAWANSINDQGGVVGLSGLANGRRHAFLWRAGKMQDLGALAGGESEGMAINSSDVVVGYSTLASGARRAVRWQNGTLTNLGSLGGRNSVALAINDLGVIVGYSEIANGQVRAFVWQNGIMRNLGTLGGSYSIAWGINRAGKVVGGATVASGAIHAFSWKDGVRKDLGTNGHLSSEAHAINTKGQIAMGVGALPDAQGQDREAIDPYIYYQQVWTPIGGGDITNNVWSINDGGTVVGWGFDFRDETLKETAWVSRPGALDILPPLTPATTNRNEARDINSFGTIVGSSAVMNGSRQGPIRAVLWRRQ